MKREHQDIVNKSNKSLETSMTRDMNEILSSDSIFFNRRLNKSAKRNSTANENRTVHQ